MGDGECAEGSVWEAAMSAAHFRLGNLTAIVDWNRLQYDGFTGDIMSLDDFPAKWRAFGWDVSDVDGHDVEALLAVFTRERHPTDRPHIVVARTVKGKGVSFMENKREWHHGRITKTQYEEALAGLPVAGKGEL
jgi:transketolase